jgi:hypothetical protein
MKPKIGAIVHFIDAAGDHYPGVILWVEESSFAVFESGTPEWCNLLVWDRSGNPSLKQQVVCDPTAKHPGTWHFPEA